jgi:hypothetical protein
MCKCKTFLEADGNCPIVVLRDKNHTKKSLVNGN